MKIIFIWICDIPGEWYCVGNFSLLGKYLLILPYWHSPLQTILFDLFLHSSQILPLNNQEYIFDIPLNVAWDFEVFKHIHFEVKWQRWFRIMWKVEKYVVDYEFNNMQQISPQDKFFIITFLILDILRFTINQGTKKVDLLQPSKICLIFIFLIWLGSISVLRIFTCANYRNFQN